ncbi:hypothetical protein D3C78_1174500 [compost metagenome]
MVDIDEPKWHGIAFEYQQVAAGILRGAFEPSGVFVQADFMLSVHIAAHVFVVTPGQHPLEVLESQRANAYLSRCGCSHFSIPGYG